MNYGMYNINSDFEKRRVAIYARVSTEHEEQMAALENQVEWYKPILAARPNWKLVEQYVDEGITGTSVEKRSQFLRMIEDAKAKKFDMIITREVSRFARNTVDTLQYTRMLKEYGVEVFFINDNIKTFDGDGELRLTIMATLAQDESRKTSIRVKAGLETAMKKGVLFGNGNVLGYDRVGKELVINPEQAKTVRLIFDMYLSGMGVTKIAYELEKMGRRTASGLKKWYPATVAHTLNNSFYCGIITYHKEYVADYLKQKKVKNLGEIALLKVKGPHTPIITEEEYNRVQEIKNSKAYAIKNGPVGKRKNKVGHARNATTVWPRIMRCSCGARFNQRSWNHHGSRKEIAFMCCRLDNTGSVKERSKKGLSIEGVCTTPIIPEWKLQLIAKKVFSECLNIESNVIERSLELLKAHLGNGYSESVSERLTALIKDQEKLKRQREILIEMRMEEVIEKEEFLQKKADLDSQIEAAVKEIEELSAKPEEGVDGFKTVEEKLSGLKRSLDRYMDHKKVDQKVIPETVVEAFTRRIIASAKGFDWYLKSEREDDGSDDADLEDFDPRGYSIMYSINLTIEDAKKYVYSFSTRRLVHGWKDITINLWI